MRYESICGNIYLHICDKLNWLFVGNADSEILPVIVFAILLKFMFLAVLN